MGDDCICKEEKNVISRDVALREEYETPSLTVLGTLAEITHYKVPATGDALGALFSGF